MKFLNCEMEFECPQDWEGMILSGDVNVRHCSACNKDVYFCHTVDDLKKAIDAQHCVTYISAEVIGKEKELDALISDLDNKRQAKMSNPRITRTTGIPTGYRGLQSLFESDDKDEWKS